MDSRIRLQVRNADCSLCRMRSEAEGLDICVTAEGTNPEAKILVVSKSPGGKRYKETLTASLEEVGFDLNNLLFTGAVKCRTWELEPSKTDVKTCKTYLEREIEVIKPTHVLALGNEALLSLTGHSGITKYRGQVFEHHSGAKVIPTISPSMVLRNPGQRGSFIADLNFAKSVMDGTVDDGAKLPDEYLFIKSKSALEKLLALLKNTEAIDAVAVDIETNGPDEFVPDAVIVSLAMTIRFKAPLEGREKICVGIPLCHPQSPFRSQWQKVLRMLCRVLRPLKLGAHNGKFDFRWILQFGLELTLKFDTMLAAHVLDENREKGLKPLARMIFGAPPWAVNTRDLMTMPIDEVLEYNCLDTWWTIHLWEYFKEQLLHNKVAARLFIHLMMPGSSELIDIERHGIWVDVEKLATNRHIAQSKLEDVETQLMQFVPAEIPEQFGKSGVNFNPSNFLRWLLFEHLELPVIARGKPKDDGTEGQPSVAEAVMIALKDQHPIVPLLIDRVWWYRAVNSFLDPYAEQLRGGDRIHTNYKLTGTVTGRLSSGKADEDKVTAKRQIRGVNMQQVPRDTLVRGVFGAPSGSWFVQADQSQVELRIAAMLANERNMISHYVRGEDLHMAMAMRMTGKPAKHITKEERKKAKPVNFGYLYGMSWAKFQTTALVNYGVVFNDAEAQASRQAFFEMWPDLRAWHARQKKLAHKYKRVVSPLGRVRNLPDIDSPNNGVMAEAERQAINSPVQSFASDLTLLAMIRISRRLREEGYASHVIGTVHDAVNLEVLEEEMESVLPLIKHEMEHPPLKRLFGVELSVPLVADISVGKYWGGATELTTEQVHEWPFTRAWIMKELA